MEPPVDQDGAERIARAFVEARQTPVALPCYPGAPPRGLAEAYAIQDAALRRDGRRVAGWKVGRIASPLDVALGTNRLAGPIFADQIVTCDPADAPSMPIFAGGFAAIEAEFLLRLGDAPDPARTRWSVADARELVDAVHVGVEIASSPYAGINRDGPLVTISDFGNNNGLIVGAAIADWRAQDLGAIAVSTEVDGVLVGEATAAAMLDGPFGAVRFLLENAAARGIRLNAGDWVSSGAVTGVHQVAGAARFEARFGGHWAVRGAVAPYAAG